MYFTRNTAIFADSSQDFEPLFHVADFFPTFSALVKQVINSCLSLEMRISNCMYLKLTRHARVNIGEYWNIGEHWNIGEYLNIGE